MKCELAHYFKMFIIIFIFKINFKRLKTVRKKSTKLKSKNELISVSLVSKLVVVYFSYECTR